MPPCPILNLTMIRLLQILALTALILPYLRAEQRPLSLREAVAMALERNPELAIEKTQRSLAPAALLQAKGAFDPLLRVDFNRRSSTNPATSILEGVNGRVDIKEWRQGAFLRQRLPWSGISWEAGFEGNRTSTTNPFTSLNPYFGPRATLALTIPLARFRVTDRERTEVLVRQKQLLLAGAEFEQRITALVARVETAYWTWVAAQANWKSAQELAELAGKALASTERLAKEGELAEAEKSGARGVFKRRSEGLAAAKVELDQAENNLKMLLTADSTDPLWQAELLPSDLTSAEVGTDLGEALQSASQKRPEFRSADLQRQAAELQTRLARELRKPAIDLTASYVSQGLAGREVAGSNFEIPGFPLTTVPPLLLGGLGSAGRQVFQNRFPVVQAGISFELPLRNRSAAGQLQQAELALRKAKLDRTQLEKLIALEVRQTYAELNAASRRISLARAAAMAARERLESELRLFREGQSSNLNVNVRQNELAESQQLVIAAERGFNLAQAEARRVTAQSLDFFGVTVR